MTITDETTITTDEFAEKIFDAVRGAAQIQGIYLGDRLGWYRVLAEEGPLTAAELAHRTATVERYAREWLEHQAVSGIVTADLTLDPVRFALPRAYVDVLVNDDSATYMAPMARFFTATGARLSELVQAYRIGGGVSWEQLGVDAREAQAAINRPLFLHQLASQILPQIPDLDELLRSGARVADVGCGEGWSTIGLALGYPDVDVHGFDVDEPSIAAARRNASQRGVAERAMFTVADPATAPAATYDAVFAFECIHDLGDPVRVLQNIRRIAKPGAAVVVMDERTADTFDPAAGAVEELLYGYSIVCCLPDGMSHADSAATGTVMHASTLDAYARSAGFSGAVEELLYGYSIVCCLPDGMSHADSAATGTVMRASTLDAYARSAGFSGAVVLGIEHDFFRFYRLQ